MSKALKKPATKADKPTKAPSRPSIQSKTSLKAGDKSKPSAPTKKKKPPPEFVMPAFSICPKPKEKIDWEAIKAKTMRRLAPEGEDIKEIRRILKEVKDQNIPVHDFINLVSPYTADNGAELRTIMAEDEAAFLKISRKVYGTMTQDVSDVLVNEQLHLAEYYEERLNLNKEKMMRAINEIYEMAPEFDFEKFARDRGEYLKSLLPIPIVVQKAPEELELQRRQEAYHRLQWLRSEGGRMSEENKRMQRRLEELKAEQKREQLAASEAAAEAEAKRQELVIEETKMKDQLDELNRSVEKSFIDNEAAMSQQHNVVPPVSRPSTSKQLGAKKKKKRPARKGWVSDVAAEMDERAIQEAMVAEAGTIPPTPKIEVYETPTARKPTRQRSPFHFSPIKTPPAAAPPRERSPFHFSPIKTPPAAAPPRERSPFHYSPPPEPPRPQRQASPFHYSPPPAAPAAPREVLEDTRIEQAQVRVQQQRAAMPTRSRGMAPKDTWGGFY